MLDDIVKIKNTLAEILNVLQSCAIRLSLIEAHMNIGAEPPAQPLTITTTASEDFCQNSDAINSLPNHRRDSYYNDVSNYVSHVEDDVNVENKEFGKVTGADCTNGTSPRCY